MFEDEKFWYVLFDIVQTSTIDVLWELCARIKILFARRTIDHRIVKVLEVLKFVLVFCLLCYKMDIKFFEIFRIYLC